MRTSPPHEHNVSPPR